MVGVRVVGDLKPKGLTMSRFDDDEGECVEWAVLWDAEMIILINLGCEVILRML